MMPAKLSVDARKLVMVSATEEARRRGDRRLGTDHLLLGLLHDEGSPAAKALGVTLAQARAAQDALDVSALSAIGIEVEALGRHPGLSFGRRLPPLTSGARAVIKDAVDEARPLKTGRIGTTHFLIALLQRQRPDPTAELLEALGVDREAVRRRVAELGEEDGR
jgi:ATP-dependent Clp protease ATP-binding subunit ClpA